jgi:hypothetical protein
MSHAARGRNGTTPSPAPAIPLATTSAAWGASAADPAAPSTAAAPPSKTDLVRVLT